jgi:hypothetical protein
MDQHARQNIAAAAAVHQELGRDYDLAVAEGLIERIGEEIDKRVDARLAQSGSAPPPVPRPRVGPLVPGSRSAWPAAILGLGSMGIGAGLSAGIVAASTTVGPYSVTHHFGGDQVFLVAFIWIMIAVINIAFSRRP